ncbi:tetratricopeptide repeat protein [Chitinophaga sp. Mgbs1]|uniref:Tetratricopeptide repeat protein n=1 Tax=Chitinophaga solisilvae TaxID=1233460 RepID=A0A3S1D148_9BACT|nr:tetratricopeptide repeat protein [Chitinophaga solisilvae]
MGLFGFLKKKNLPASHSNEADNSYETKFEEEVLRTIPRYISMPGAAVDIRVRHRKTNKIISFAIAYPDQFNTWKTVKSVADRRGIIYSLLDEQLGPQLQLWQIMERFNDDRNSQKALELALQYMDATVEEQPDFNTAMARTYFLLTQFEQAEQYCLKAQKLDPGHIRTKRIYADILHCTGRHEQAHRLYEEILNAKLTRDQQLSLSVQQLLGFDGDYINSPVYAFSWLSNMEDTSEEIWDWANDEFYYSPYFRAQHAYRLIERQEHLRGLAKLLSLVEEMPWYKEAVVNCFHLIEQSGMQEQLKEEYNWLERLMAKEI